MNWITGRKTYIAAIVAVLAFVLVGAVVALPAQTALAQEAETAETTARLNFRRGPGIEYDSIRVLAIGEEVTLTGLVDETGEWVEVSLEDGSVGWVAVEFLSGTFDLDEFEVWVEEDTADEGDAADEEAGEADTVFPSTVVTATTAFNLNLRNGPSLDATILDVLPAGTVVGFTGFQDATGDWVQVDPVGSQVGWVWAEYLTFVPAELSVAGAEPEPADEETDETDEAGVDSGAVEVEDFGPLAVYTTTTLYNLNLRDEPSLDAARRDLIPADTVVALTGFIDETGDWVQIVTADGQVGWVWGEYLFFWPDDIMTVWEG